MSLNCSEINLILEELDLPGYFIQKIEQPSYSSLVLYLYRREALTLFFSLAGGECRLHSTDKRFAKPKKPLRFMELLRSRILGCRIIEAKQIDADRIVQFTLANSEEEFILYARLWSGAGNIFLTNSENKIIDAFYRRPKKNEIGGKVFELPEPKSEDEIKASFEKFPVREHDSGVSFNKAIEMSYANKLPEVSRESLIAELDNMYHSKVAKLETALKTMKKKKASFENAEQFKHYGDLLFANLHLIKEGMSSIELDDFIETKKIKLNLNPQMTPQENANSYYEKYKSMVSGSKTLTTDIKTAELQINTLAEQFNSLKAEENLKALKKSVEKLRQSEQAPILKNKQGKEFKGLRFNIDGWHILVGRTSAENDDLLRYHVRGADLWLHVRDYAGGYVFIKSQKNKSVPLPVLLSAGNLAVFYSKARRAGEADLYYTEVKHLRRAKGATRGTVLPTHEKNLFVKLSDEILKKTDEGKILS